MSNIQTGAERMPHDLSHLGFLAGQIGRLITISTTPVIAGDSFEMDAVGALRLSPLRRGLAIDSTVDIFTFYVPHRHVYGEQWIKFMKDGVNATPLPTVNTTGYIDHAAFLGTINPVTNKIPKHLFQGYLNIYNNYFKAPWMPDRTEANPNELNQDDARYGFRCCHLKNIWTAPLPPETELSRQMTTSTTSIDIMGLQAAYANLHTDQERDYFMQRYHDVISSFGGKTSYDADNRPLLVMRSNLWASGYDVDGTDQTSLGQFSGRVQQTYKHSVPRFFVTEHGTMFTLALVRSPPTATKEIQYLNAKGALTYTDIAGYPVLYGNLPPREMSMRHVFLSFFFFNDTATTEIYTLSLHDALPILLFSAQQVVRLLAERSSGISARCLSECKRLVPSLPPHSVPTAGRAEMVCRRSVLLDRKSTRLNSSHSQISYAVFCLKKKKTEITRSPRVLVVHAYTTSTAARIGSMKVRLRTITTQVTTMVQLTDVVYGRLTVDFTL